MSKFILSFPKYFFKNVDDFKLTLGIEANELLYEISCAYCQSLDKDESVKLSNKIISLIKFFFRGGTNLKEDMGDIPIFAKIVGLVMYPVSL